MNRWRRPAWWSVLLVVAGVALFVRLGFWQLHRAQEKEALLQRYAAAAAAPERDFAEVARRPEASFVPVRVHGRYRADRLYLLDNPHHDARGGMEVFAPFVLRGSDAPQLLVDLGFLPAGPVGAREVPALPAGEQVLTGLYAPPPGAGWEMGGDALRQQGSWPKTTIYLDLPQVSADLGVPLYPRVLALDADPTSPYLREHALDVSAMPPARHRAYAFQWFSFAAAIVVIGVILHRPRRPANKPRQ